MVVGDSLSLVLQVMMRHSVPCMHTCVHAACMHTRCTPITPIAPISYALPHALPHALPYALCLVHSFAFRCRWTHAACIQASRACVHTSMGIRMQACRHAWAGMRKIWNASRICVSSLRRGHANLLCIVPILVYVSPERTRYSIRIVRILMQEPSLKTLTCGTPSGTPQGVRAKGLWFGFEP